MFSRGMPAAFELTATIAPRPWRAMARPKARVTLKVPVAFTPITRSHSCGAMSRIGAIPRTPAAWTPKARGPCTASTPATSASVASASRTSSARFSAPGTGAACRAASVSVAMTRAPASTSAATTLRPMPPASPVTMAVRS